jgi:uncharacterized protein YhjY with autotransporter beta-barrel domain
MKMKAHLCLLLTTLLAVPALGDTVLNFDDLPDPGNNLGTLNTYDGFTFSTFAYISTSDTTFSGVHSPPNAALTVGGSNAITINSTTPFNFVSAYITSAQMPTTTFEIWGVNAQGQHVGTETLTVNTTPTLYTFNFDSILSIDMLTTWYTTFDDLDFTGVSFGSHFASLPGLTPNQRGIASSIDAGGLNSASSGGVNRIITALNSLPTTTVVGQALDQMSPGKTARFFSTTAFNNAAFDVQDMDDYLDEQRGANGSFVGGNGQLDSSGLVVNDPNVDPGLQMIHSRMLAWNDLPQTISDIPGTVLGGVDMKDTKQMTCANCAANDKPWNFFLRGSVILGQGFSQDDVPHYDDNTESVVAGADYRFTPNILAGATMSYAHTDATLDDFGSSSTVDSYSPGVYASYSDGGWYSNFVGRYSYNTYTEQRNITFLGQSASGGTNGNEGMVALDGGYNFHTGPWTYGPVAGLQYTHLTVNSYQESDSAAALSVNEDQSDSLRSRLGGLVRFDSHWGGVTLSPHLEATWQHEFMDESRGITSQFTQFSGGSFDVRTPSPSQDSALVDLGLDAQVDKCITVFGDYLVQAGQSNYFGQSVQAGVKINF